MTNINDIFSEDFKRSIPKAIIALEVFHAALTNNIIPVMEQAKQERLNRKWQRIFAGLIILNALIWYNILTQ